VAPRSGSRSDGTGGTLARQCARLPDLQIFGRRVSSVYGLEFTARARRFESGEGDRYPFGDSGDRDRHTDQYPQSEAVDFFLAFLPQFVSAGELSPMLRMVELSALFMLMTFVIFVGYGLCAASVRDHVISRPRVLTWMRRAFASAFVALGAKLAFADR
jgi:hypothetical protein